MMIIVIINDFRIIIQNKNGRVNATDLCKKTKKIFFVDIKINRIMIL